MSLVIATIIGFAFLDAPWRWIVIGGAFFIEGLEVLLWLKLRHKRSTTGIETMIGERGKAMSRLDPTGQVQVRGQVWTATSTVTVEAGSEVTVTASEGLRLSVEPLDLHEAH